MGWWIQAPWIKAKSLYASPAVSHFNGTEYEAWAGFGPVGSTEKNGADYEQRLKAVFSCFQGQKNLSKIQKYCSIWAKNLHRMMVRKMKRKILIKITMDVFTG